MAATPAVRGFDCLASVEHMAPEFAEAGFAFAVRYVGLNLKHPSLTRAEAEAILDAGLALMVVQRGAEWKDRAPSKDWGQTHGEAAIEGAQAIGYPQGAVLWLDLESVHSASPSEVIAYAQAWKSVVGRRYRPGLYVGPSAGLDPAQLSQLDFEHYWKAGAAHVEPDGRDYAMVQHHHQDVAGLTVDVDRTEPGATALPWVQPGNWTAKDGPAE